MILPLQQSVRRALRETLTHLYGADAVPATLVIDTPPQRRLGDLALPFAFELARTLRKAPRAIAQEVVAAWPALDGIDRVEAAPNGYVNVFLDRAAFLRARLGTAPADPSAFTDVTPGKTIVEHTAINPNKAAHIGHLRNAAMGDTFARLLRFCGTPVEVQNYIDDTGVQVADVVVGFQQIESRTLEEVQALAAAPKFDYYCWDLYAQVTDWYAADAARLKVRSQTLHAIEHGEAPTAAMGAIVADAIVRCHLRTMGRMNIDYDLLSWEGDILRLQFWATAFETLKANGTVYFQETGRLAGCWVMQIDEDIDATVADGPPVVDESAPAEAAEDQREKVIVRSDGTVTYVGKDIAYQFWKFGLLGRDFQYRRFATRLDGEALWATCSADGETPHPEFGGARQVINVIDTRQSYLQKLLKQALAIMGHAHEARHSIHFAYEMVALTHRTARELGYQGDADGKPFVEVSGRKGLGVKADDLLDRLTDKALDEVRRRNPDQPAADARRAAEQIAVAAVRYFLVKFSRTKFIAFDIDEALSFEGESGPYLQYAAVRAGNILRKLEARDGVSADDVADALASLDVATLSAGEDGDAMWDLVLSCARLDEVVENAVRALEPSVLAKYAFGLAQSFNGFYHRFPILAEDDRTIRLWRAAAASYFRQQVTRALELMGGAVPERM